MSPSNEAAIREIRITLHVLRRKWVEENIECKWTEDRKGLIVAHDRRVAFLIFPNARISRSMRRISPSDRLRLPRENGTAFSPANIGAL